MFIVLILLLAYPYAHGFATFSSKNLIGKEGILMSASSAIDAEDCAKCPNAPKCSGEYLTQGCDGTGKIQGGISTISIFSWWPIKVFRPCPSYLAAGYQYRREGQTMDQVLFSEPSNKMKAKIELMRLEEEKVRLQSIEAEGILKKQAIAAKALTDTKQLTEEEKFLEENFKKKQ